MGNIHDDLPLLMKVKPCFPTVTIVTNFLWLFDGRIKNFSL